MPFRSHVEFWHNDLFHAQLGGRIDIPFDTPDKSLQIFDINILMGTYNYFYLEIGTKS